MTELQFHSQACLCGRCRVNFTVYYVTPNRKSLGANNSVTINSMCTELHKYRAGGWLQYVQVN